MKVSKFGDWTRAGTILQGLSVSLCPAFKAQLQEDGELILKTLLSHIDKQDLNWTPLADRTVELKGGDTTIYVETGYLQENLQVRKIKAPKDGTVASVNVSQGATMNQGDLLVSLN